MCSGVITVSRYDKVDINSGYIPSEGVVRSYGFMETDITTLTVCCE